MNNFQNDLFSIQIYQLLIRLTFQFKSIDRINIEGEMVSTLLLLEYWLSLCLMGRPTPR